MLADLAPKTRRRRALRFGLPNSVRRALTACHVLASVGWLAYVAFVLALSVYVYFADDPERASAVWMAVKVLGDLGVGAVSFAVLGTGLALGLSTRWGVVRHWWVIAKLAAAFAVVLGGLLVLRPSVARLGRHLEDSGATEPSAHLELTVGAAVAFAVLMFAAVLSYAKPWGPVRRSAEVPLEDGRFDVRVRRGVLIAGRVRSIELVGVNNRLLPPFEAGAHIELELPSGMVRHYSLCSDPADRLSYRIAVRREDAGSGGSREVHRLRHGDLVRISPPRNMFSLSLHPYYLFVAGGIGITPIVSMICQVERARLPWRLVYTGRSRTMMAFADQLATTWPGNVVLYPTDTAGRPNLVAEVAGLPSGTGVYACGPDPMVRALSETVERVAPHVELRSERFATGPSSREPFELVAKRSGAAVAVGTDQSALDALLGAGVEVPSSCEIGVCGTCRLRVVDGRPDNPSQVAEPVAPDGAPYFYPCVGRARDHLVVDA
ncbi:PDR/VanB family oxidoreductase [Glycomyces xiaoerkulensis]|uniref:PDR/VanB family oxidoreductase n=1 Tax=Glycomyces xiaoerkulensis TaxID=2038139 RepID=UPI0018E434B6|nr:PDR/VanB family oxidoreductase [Glycomyces xiaoerkulensis]